MLYLQHYGSAKQFGITNHDEKMFDMLNYFLWLSVRLTQGNKPTAWFACTQYKKTSEVHKNTHNRVVYYLYGNILSMYKTLIYVAL